VGGFEQILGENISRSMTKFDVAQGQEEDRSVLGVYRIYLTFQNLESSDKLMCNFFKERKTACGAAKGDGHWSSESSRSKQISVRWEKQRCPIATSETARFSKILLL
jgi:hypothetical protein